MKLSKSLVGIGILSLLAGCANLSPVLPPKETLAKIHTIVVVRTPEPQLYTVRYFKTPASLLGAVGGLVAQKDMDTKQEALTAALGQQSVSFYPRVADAIAAKLTAMGYQARAEDGVWDVVEGGRRFNLEKSRSDADATLVLVPGVLVGVGFTANWVFGEYSPSMTMNARVYGRDGKTELYKTFNVYGYEPVVGDYRVIPTQTRFANFDAVISDIPGARASLLQAGNAMAQLIADDFKR